MRKVGYFLHQKLAENVEKKVLLMLFQIFDQPTVKNASKQGPPWPFLRGFFAFPELRSSTKGSVKERK